MSPLFFLGWKERNHHFEHVGHSGESNIIKTYSIRSVSMLTNSQTINVNFESIRLRAAAAILQ